MRVCTDKPLTRFLHDQCLCFWLNAKGFYSFSKRICRMYFFKVVKHICQVQNIWFSRVPDSQAENFSTQLKLICSIITGLVWKFHACSIHLVWKSDASKSQYAINNTSGKWCIQTEPSLLEINEWLDEYMSTCHFGSQYKYQASQLSWHIEQVQIKRLSHYIAAWLINSELQAQ